MSVAPVVSVVVPTYNRGPVLRLALESLIRQRVHGIPFELIVIDNNSTDATRAVIEDFAARSVDVPVEYVFEPQQGVSHARNAGIARARAPIVAFVDDDVEAGDTWLMRLATAFERYPEADCIGGRVTAKWTRGRPSWLTDEHLGPLAVKEWPHGVWVSRAAAWPCLLAANFACRRDVFNEVGRFSPAFPRGQDREFQLRLWDAGKRGLYLPEIEVFVDVPAERLTRAYHRRWHATTARYHALMRYRDRLSPDGALDDQAWRTCCGTPLFIYREGLEHLAGWLTSMLRLDADRAFYHETRLWYTVAFVRTRLTQRWRERVRRERFWAPGPQHRINDTE